MTKGEPVEVATHCVGPDLFEGMLGDTLVQARVTEEGARLTLWMPLGFGRNPCGHGKLEQVPGGDVVLWVGTAEDTVRKKSWAVSGRLGHDTLDFAPGRPV